LQNKEFIGFNEQILDRIADALKQCGYIVLPQVINNTLLEELQLRVQELTPQQWKQAGIGHKQEHQYAPHIRSDKIVWITADNLVESAFLSCMEKLRQGINRRLFLGLFDYESHFAIYPQGSSYQKHVDALKGKSNRVLSTVFYLNSNWQPSDAGELLIYSGDMDKPVQSVLPQLGTFVIFLSEQVPHEVIKANRQRFSIAGWFRVNPSHSQYIDPVY